MELSKLGDRLREIRKSAGLTRKYIQDNYGFPEATLHSWESGKVKEIRISNLIGYLDIYKDLGVDFDLDNLFFDQELMLNAARTDARNNFLDTSLCISLLKNTTNLFFYSDKNGRLLYLDTKYLEIVIPDISKEFIDNNVTVEKLLTIIKDQCSNKIEYANALIEVLDGNIVDMLFIIRPLGSRLNLRLYPNMYVKDQSVIGFFGTIVSEIQYNT